MADKPRIRPIEAFPVKQDGKTLIYLKDPLNLATPLGISPVGYFVLAHFDGAHSFVEIQEAYSKRFGTLLMTDELKQFVAMLDQHYYLQSERFENYQQAVIAEFRLSPTRVAAHVGGGYKSDPLELMAQLDSYFTAPKGPGLPSAVNGNSTPKAIVAPHIDFHRGGPSYAWAYKPLAESAGADLYIILGTSHCGGQTPYILTHKGFETPLGLVETDSEFVGGLQAACAEDCFSDEYLHRGEHSIEFQVLFLKYIAQKRAALTGEPEKPFKIVPILVSSFHAMMMSQTLPEATAPVGNFLRTLRRLAQEDARQICFVAGVDLAHVGKQFGDEEPVTEDFLKWVEAEDHKLVDRLSALDAPGFFNEIAKDEDKRKICGFAPLYSLIHLLDGSRGNHLHYDQAFTPETGSAVTFASLIFE
ncbi:MAG TPA: AmmeMemoRadiSam system protein B [Candidatus Binatus sp.]|nr:AmmeMemoRadiSam system protein B [Candidatus Binatus sp.]